MKLEKPPYTTLNTLYLQQIGEGMFEAFLHKTDEKYDYWDDLKYKKEMPLETPFENWALLKSYRRAKYQILTIGSYRFHYFVSASMAQSLHAFDLALVNNLQVSSALPTDKAAFFHNTLLEEAVASSQVEGAATTTEVAREMLQSGRNPRNESEQMILNNVRAIAYISEAQDAPIDFKMILELHKIMTANTRADQYAGEFRKSEVFITDHIDGEIAHIPPTWQEVAPLMHELCAFVNDEQRFVHPIVKAAIIHFLIGFIHPFTDGNGRTARALFYWYLLKKGYVLLKSLSISSVILESHTQYDKAFLKTEYDDHDLNYFIYYSLKNLKTAFDKLRSYRNKKSEERKQANAVSYALLQRGLNKRQADLLGRLYLKDLPYTTLHNYAATYQVVRQTASRDLNELVKARLLTEQKSNKPHRFMLADRAVIERFVG